MPLQICPAPPPKRSPNPSRDELIESHLSLVGPIARHIHSRLPVTFDLLDLVSAGTLGLIRAADKRDCSTARDPEAMFRAFARQAIRGTILDYVRRNNYAAAKSLPLEAARGMTVEPDGPRLVESSEIAESIWYALRSLSDQEIHLVYAHYWGGASLVRAGAKMGLSQCAATRLHRQALAKMKNSLRLAGRAMRMAA